MVRLKPIQTLAESRVEPSQPPCGWSSTSLICPLASRHQSNKVCFEHAWKWAKSNNTSASNTFLLNDDRQILFHPRSSSSTQAVLTDQPLPKEGRHYWEIHLPAVYGTSLMFGIATDQQPLTSSKFTDLIGIDQHGWGLSHQGLLWHNGCSSSYLPQPLTTFQPVLIGLEFDADARTLFYFVNHQPMGVAFHSIPSHVSIYPAVSSTSAQSTMVLQHCCRLCSSLGDICLKVIRAEKCLTYIDEQSIPRHLSMQMRAGFSTVKS